MRLAQKTLNKLPKVRLYVGQNTFFKVPYMNAKGSARLPLALDDFKPDGKGLAWNCGISNAIMRQRDLFNHPVFYAHTIGSTVYVVAMVGEGNMPRFAFRYRHRGGPLVDLYDASRKDSTKWTQFTTLLEEHPYLSLEKGRAEIHRRGSHDTKKTARGNNPHVDKNKRGLQGAKRRAIAAGFIPDGLSV